MFTLKIILDPVCFYRMHHSEEEVHRIRTGGENANIHIHEWTEDGIRVELAYFNGHLGDSARITAEEKKV